MIARLPLVSALAAALAGCVTAGQSCGAGFERRSVVELIFGRNIGDRLGVSEADWRRFLDEEVTSRFPNGFTVLDGRGQYRDAERARIVREPSKVLVIVLSKDSPASERLSAIVEAYRQRFRQQSVLSLTRTSCVSF